MSDGQVTPVDANGILIVDDSEFLRNRMRDALEQLGYLVVGEAANGNDAVTAYRELRPALVTMDVVMPNLDGISAVRAIRGLDPGAKVIMVTSMGNQDKVLESLRAGAMNFVVKPFTVDQIERVVRRVLPA